MSSSARQSFQISILESLTADLRKQIAAREQRIPAPPPHRTESRWPAVLISGLLSLSLFSWNWLA